MKNIIALFIFFMGYSSSVWAFTIETPASSSGIVDSTLTVGYSTQTAVTVESARSMALHNALEQALSFIDTSFTNCAHSADEAYLKEASDVKIIIDIQKTDQGYKATARCKAIRTSAYYKERTPPMQAR